MKKYCYEIFVGIKDQNDNLNHYGLDEIKYRFKKFSLKYAFPFSLSIIQGGYKFKNGEYVIEDCLRFTIVGDLDENHVALFCSGIKKIFNQESILIIRNKLEQMYV